MTPSHTKKGPGRIHDQGLGHKMSPAEVEVSSMHPVFVMHLHQARSQGLNLTSNERQDLRRQIKANGGRA